MKFDFHVHAMMAKYLPFQMDSLRNSIFSARQKGLNGFALVDHIHYPGYWRTCSLIRKEYSCVNGMYITGDDFRIISGAEINLRKEGHILLLADIEEIFAIDGELKLSQGYYPSLQEIQQMVSPEAILIGAHPFRPFYGLMQYKPSEIQFLDALELNGSDHENAGKVRKFAEIIHMPVIGGSDAHYWPAIGISHTIFADNVGSLPEIKQAIRAGSTETNIESDAAITVDLCNRYKARSSTIYRPTTEKQTSMV